jgi:hypothetical protein
MISLISPFPDAASRLHRLAAELVGTLGVEGAQRACRENAWYGVYSEIRRHWRAER